MELLSELLKNQSNMTGMTSTSMTTEYDGNEYLHRWGLDNVQCEKCHNTGYITEIRDGILYSNPCSCLKERVSKRRLKQSGMEDMAARNTFDNFSAETKQLAKIKDAADRYANNPSGWFYLCGRSGSGKTHLCTAMCQTIIKAGTEVGMMMWREDSRRLKAMVNDPEAETLLHDLKNIPVLYIDDFFKGGITEADVRLAFEILNYRYNNSWLLTIISSEYDLKSVFGSDEALASRIYERAKGNVFKMPDKNWRIT